MPLSPKRAGNNCLARARGLLRSSTLTEVAPRTREDLRRLALVMGVVAVDAYMHWAVFRRLSEVRREGELPKALRQLQVPFDELAFLAEATVAARRRGVDSRPWVQLKNAAQKCLLRKTLQSSRGVGDAMAMVGINDGWKSVATAMNLKAEEVKSRLDMIVDRRNQIVHEGDLARQSRPRRVRRNPIGRLEVEGDLVFLESLVNALHGIMKDT